MQTVVLYGRVSSEEQAQVNLSIPSQLAELERYALQHGFQVLERFKDEGFSAYVSASTRPAFQAMMRFCSRTKTDAVLVWKMDRFARNREDAALYKGLLSRKGTRVISICEPMEDNASGRLMEGMLDLLAEFYSAQIGSDVKRGLKARVERGLWPGGTAPFGYRSGLIMVDGRERPNLVLGTEEEVTTVRNIYRLSVEERFGCTRILNWLLNNNPLPIVLTWKPNTVFKILHNAIYIGCLYKEPNQSRYKHVTKSDLVPGQHTPIIMPEQYWSAQEGLKSRRYSTPRIQRRTSHLLTGLIFCACGKRMYYQHYRSIQRKQSYEYYACPPTNRQSVCVSSAPYEKINAHVLSTLQTQLSPTCVNTLEAELYTQYAAAVKSLEAPDTIQRTRAQLIQKIERLYEAIESGGDIKTCTARISVYQDQLQSMVPIDKSESRLNLEQARDRILVRLKRLRTSAQELLALPYEVQRELVLAYVERVDVSQDGMKVNLRLDGELAHSSVECSRFHNKL